MDFDEFSAHPPSFGIPAHVIANLECLAHSSVLVRSAVQKKPRLRWRLDHFPAQNSMPLASGQNHPIGGKLQLPDARP
jgi:hypothetical protein